MTLGATGHVHGLSGWSFADQALAMVASSSMSTATVLVGWSLGGLHALQEFSRGPARWQAGILIASTARFCGDGDWPGLPRSALRGLQRQLQREPRAALEGFHRLCAGPGAAPELIAQRVTASLDLGLDNLARGLRELDELDLRPALPTVDVPMLILHGARDRVIPVQAAERMVALLPRATLYVHPEAEHDLPLAHPDWVKEHVLAFLQKHS